MITEPTLRPKDRRFVFMRHCAFSLILVAFLFVGTSSIQGLAATPEPDPRPPSADEIRGSLPLPKSEESTSAPAVNDPVRQLQYSINSMPAPITNWEGIPSTGVYPPDTDGQVGPNHYVQIVNAAGTGSRIRIWDKAGNLLYDFGMNGLWPSGDRCNLYGYGDPVVLYDQIADRWLLTQFTYPPSGPYQECIAVSKTGTPTNNSSDWYLYTFNVHNTKFNDYPKLGVWPDGYYMMAHQFTSIWAGTGVWVFNRTKMLDGTLPQAPSSITCSTTSSNCQYQDLYTLNPNYGGMLPVNLVGDTLPPEGSPNYFVEVDADWYSGTDVMTIFGFQVDWNTPANSRFGRVGELIIAEYDNDLCSVDREHCIDQPGTAVRLEAITDRLMMHAWYRNLGEYEVIVLNHTVDGDGNGHAGIRWYEIHKTDPASPVIYDPPSPPNPDWGPWSIHQQGTFAPDSDHRWMGSIAMDNDGNIALGYSISSPSTYPGIRYTGRLATDPLGTLPQGEGIIINGSGSQIGIGARWGDYSAMSVDPVDDCTFWYTQEYMQTTSFTGWQTRIASFKFPNCQKGPSGILEGFVREADTNTELAGVLVEISASITQTYQTITGNDGYYIIQLPVDTYTVTAETNGYYQEIITGTNILEEEKSTLDIHLKPFPKTIVEGYVRDEETNWPLYAHLEISNTGINETIFTNPVTGYYSVTLHQNLAYSFTVDALSGGYFQEILNVIPDTSAYSQNFALEPDLITCTLPGYALDGSTCAAVSDGLGIGAVKAKDTHIALNSAFITDAFGNSVNTFATPGDPDQPDGFYIIGLSTGENELTAWYSVYGPVTKHVSLATGSVTRQDFALPWANLQPDPASLEAELVIITSTERTLVLNNTGSYTSTFELAAIHASTTSPTPGQYFLPTRRFSPKHVNDLDASWFDLYQPIDMAAIPAGQVIQTFDTGLEGLWGLGVDALGNELWLSDNSISGGNDQLHKFTTAGTDTGRKVNMSGTFGIFGADMAYDPIQKLLWQVDVGGSNCIYAVDPASQLVTGQHICPQVAATQRGLAYDLTSNTFYLGSWNDGSIHHVNTHGEIIDSKNINLNISGLAFNPITHHIFVLSNANKGFDIYVLDVDSDYAILGGFDIAGLHDFAQAGLGIDCQGSLWIANQTTGQIIQAASGETGICAWVGIPWLSPLPITGTVPVDGSQDIMVRFDTTDFSPGIYQAQIRVDNNNPSGEFYIPITMSINLPNYAVSITPEIDTLVEEPGKTVTYYLDVTNTGQNEDSYDISITSNWMVSFPAAVGPLLSGETQTIQIEITIPANENLGNSDTATITLTSQADNSISATAHLITKTAAHIIYLPNIFR